MSNEEKTYLTQLNEINKRQRRTITTFSITNTILSLVIIGIIIVKTFIC